MLQEKSNTWCNVRWRCQVQVIAACHTSTRAAWPGARSSSEILPSSMLPPFNPGAGAAVVRYVPLPTISPCSWPLAGSLPFCGCKSPRFMEQKGCVVSIPTTDRGDRMQTHDRVTGGSCWKLNHCLRISSPVSVKSNKLEYNSDLFYALRHGKSSVICKWTTYTNTCGCWPYCDIQLCNTEIQCY